MAKPSYSPITTATDTWKGFIERTNEVFIDMRDHVVTLANVAAPNTVNGSWTSGNGHIEGIFSVDVLSAVSELRGGTVDTPGELLVSSEFQVANDAIFQGTFTSNGLATFNSDFVAQGDNASFDVTDFALEANTTSIDSQSITINASSVDITSVTFDLAGIVNIDGPVTLGSNSADSIQLLGDVTSNVHFTGEQIYSEANTFITAGFTVQGFVTILGDSWQQGNSDIVGDLTVSGDARFGGPTGNSVIEIIAQNSGASLIKFRDQSAVAGSISYWNTDESIRIAGKGSDTEIARFDSDGNLGIGTNTPIGKLHIDGGILLSGNTTDHFFAGAGQAGIASATNSIFIFNSGDGATDYSTIIFNDGIGGADGSFRYYSANNIMQFRGMGDNSEMARFTSSGDLGIGTTTPQGKLDVAGDAYVSGNIISTGGILLSGNTASSISINGTQVSSTGTGYLGVLDETLDLVGSVSYQNSNDFLAFNGKGNNSYMGGFTSTGNMGINVPEGNIDERLVVGGNAKATNLISTANTNVGLDLHVANTTYIQGDLFVFGTTNLSSNATLNISEGVIEDLDVLNSFELHPDARVGSSLIPDTTATYNLGTSSLRWNDLYATSITATTLSGSLNWNNVTNRPDPVITVTLTGDVTGSGSATLTDLGNGTASFATTIAPNSVTLGTDTTGNYLANVAAGAGISVTGATGEGATRTIAHGDTSSAANVAIDNSGGVVLQDFALNFDTYGHVISHSSQSVNLDSRYAQNVFSTVNAGGTNLVADSLTDTLNVVGGSGINISGTAGSDTLTIASTDTLASVTSRGSSTTGAITVNGNITGSGGISVSGDAVIGDGAGEQTITMNAGGSWGNQLIFQGAGSPVASIQYRNNTNQFQFLGMGNNSEMARFNGSGDLSIGTTSSGFKLRVAGTGLFEGALVTNDGFTANTAIINSTFTASSGTDLSTFNSDTRFLNIGSTSSGPSDAPETAYAQGFAINQAGGPRGSQFLITSNNRAFFRTHTSGSYGAWSRVITEDSGSTSLTRLVLGNNSVGTVSDIAMQNNAVIGTASSVSFTGTSSTPYWRWMHSANGNETGTAGATEFARLTTTALQLQGPDLRVENETPYVILQETDAGGYGQIARASGTLYIQNQNTAGTANTGGSIVFSGPGGANLGSLSVITGGSERTIWHAGNMGASSGLDADLLDGQQGTFYRNAGNLNAGTLPNARLSAQVPLTNTGNTFTATNTFSGTLDSTGTTNLTGAVAINSTAVSTFNNNTNFNGRVGINANLVLDGAEGTLYLDGDNSLRTLINIRQGSTVQGDVRITSGGHIQLRGLNGGTWIYSDQGELVGSNRTIDTLSAGLTGGGNLSSNRSLELALGQLPFETGSFSTPRVVVVDGSNSASQSRMDPNNFRSNFGLASSGLSVNAGPGLSGGGNLGSNFSINMGTPSSITRTSTNSAGGTTHTHNLSAADFRDMIANYTVAGWIGSYVFACEIGTSGVSFGSTISGSNLYPSAESDGARHTRPGSLSGTWRCVGETPSSDDWNTVWLRIA